MVDVNMVSLISLKRFIVGGTIRYVEPVYIIYIIFTKSLAYKGYLAISGLDPIQAKPTLCHGKSKLNTIAYTLCATATFKVKFFY